MIGWISRVLRALIGEQHDPAWKATGLKFRTPRDYDEQQAFKGAKAARRRSSTGRVYPRPVKAKRDNVVDIQSQRRGRG